MKTVSITETKNRLSALLDQVRQGETIVITDRNRPVARLEPITQVPELAGDAQLSRLEREGLVRRSRQGVSRELLESEPPQSTPGSSLLNALLRNRDEGP